MVIDFIAGMTDKMFDREVKMLAKNEKKWYNYAFK
jgi:dGTP triphosphohydrolase